MGLAGYAAMYNSCIYFRRWCSETSPSYCM